jgi:hypothetical protein
VAGDDFNDGRRGFGWVSQTCLHLREERFPECADASVAVFDGFLASLAGAFLVGGGAGVVAVGRPVGRRSFLTMFRACQSCGHLGKVQSRCGYPAASFRGRVELYGVTRQGPAPSGPAMMMDGRGLTGRAWEARMTVRNASADWHGNVESGSGTVTVGPPAMTVDWAFFSNTGSLRPVAS